MVIAGLRRMTMLGFVLGLSALLTGFAQAAVDARFDRDTMHFNETVRLFITVDGADNGARPELEPIEEHFRVLGQTSSQNISLVNGQQSATRTWTLELEPRATGSFSLDPIRVGDEESLRLRISILPEEKQAGVGDVFIEVEVDPTEAYVQQQVLLTARLYLAVPLLEGALGDPETDDARVQRLGDDRRFGVTRDETRYQVFERRYAIFPQSSGQMTIPGLRFEGRLDEGGRGLFGSMMNQGRRIRATAEPLELTVKPPAGDDPTLPWVPAKALRLVDSSDPVDEYAVGQPLTLKIQLQALGLTAEQLPEIRLPEAEGLRLYPDQPEFETVVEGDNVVGLQLQRIAVIPERAGELTIPGLTVTWWNTETDSAETATLPPRTITVAAATGTRGSDTSDTADPGGELQPTESTLSGGDARQGANPNRLDGTVGSGSDTPDPSTEGETWWKIVAMVSLGLWLVSGLVLLAWFVRRRKQGIREVAGERDSREKTWRSRLGEACRANDPVAAKRSLLGWARNGGVSLDDLDGKPGNETFARESRRLDAALYAPSGNPDQWDGGALWQAVNQLPLASASKPGERPEPLDSLYPG